MRETPLVKQYLEIKKDYADALVFFRLGDFYELFFDDAIIASKVLEITLTKKQAQQEIPMCGVPHHSVLPYIKKVIEKGYRVAIAEQVSLPGKGLVKREVTQVISPGQVIDKNILDSTENNFIASILFDELGYYFSYADISTGEMYLKTELKIEDLKSIILNLKIKEIVLSNKYDKDIITFLEKESILINYYDDITIKDTKYLGNLEDNYQKKSASLLINFLKDTNKLNLDHLESFILEKNSNYLKLDNKFFNHLEIFNSNYNNDKYTLLHILDNTKTAFGSRYLKHQMLHPLNDKKILNKRYDIIEALYSKSLQDLLRNELVGVYDINRIISRIVTNKLSAIDLIWLKDSLSRIPSIKTILVKTGNKVLIDFSNSLNIHKEVLDLIEESILDNPSNLLTEGKIIKPNYNDELKKLIDISQGNDQFLEDYLNEQKQLTNIKNMKIGFNSVFGYYLEVSKSNVSDILIEYGYERKQTLANQERYTTKKLKEYEKDILNINNKIYNLEYTLFKSVVLKITIFKNSLQELAKLLAELDFYLSLSYTALTNNYIRPVFDDNSLLDLRDARHPVVEKYTKIIENDIKIKRGNTAIITGPNMGGKSTYMRTCALIIYLSHIGSFVPASYANIPLYSSLYTRIGSSDNISGGLSTFMLEMVEARDAIINSDKNSFLFFDEIGRGTATYDGMSLAQAILEYVSGNVQCQMFFSTHYHELTSLSKTNKNIINLYVDALKENNKMTFLYKIKNGSISNSYGIDVAKLAGLPDYIINRASVILNSLVLKNDTIDDFNNIKTDIFSYTYDNKISTNYKLDEISKKIKNIDINNMTPIDALILLKNLKSDIDEN